MSSRALTAVIGPTENALRALLLEMLKPSTIHGYEEWVLLTVASSLGVSPTRADVVVRAADGLKAEPTEVARVLDRLVDRGLVRVDGATLCLTPLGSEAFSQTRDLVVQTTNGLLVGLDQRDLSTTVRVLDHVRERAEEALADRATGRT